MGLLRRPVDYATESPPGHVEPTKTEPPRLRRPEPEPPPAAPEAPEAPIEAAAPVPKLRRPITTAAGDLGEVLLLYQATIVHSENPNLSTVWCGKYEQWSFPGVCLNSIFGFSKGNYQCRICLGVLHGRHWPEPFASIDRPKKDKRSKKRKRSKGAQSEAELKNIGPKEEGWENGEGQNGEG